MNTLYVFIGLMVGTLPLVLVAYVVYKVIKRTKDGVEDTDQFRYIQFPTHTLLLIASAVLAYNVFAYQTMIGIGTAVMFTTLVIISFLSIPQSKRSMLPIVLLVNGVLVSCMIGIRANGAIQFFDALYASFSIVFLLLIKSSESITWRGLWLFKQIGDLLYRMMTNIPLLRRYSKNQTTNSNVNITSILKTAFITVILLFVFAEILSSADPVFAEIIHTIKEETFARTILSLILSTLLLVVLTVRLPKDEQKPFELAWLSFSELITPLVAVVLLFSVFIFVQAKYLFGGHTDLASFGYTYSEYARKGFIELIVASLLGGLMVYFVYLKQNTISNLKQISYLTIVNVLLILELFALLLSALKRDLLYVDAYGLTRTRLIGGCVLFWIAGALLLLLLLNVLRARIKEQQMLAGIGVLSIAVMIFLNVINIDYTIAVQNPPSDSDNPIDYYYINTLSEDAIKGWHNSISSSISVYNTIRKKNHLTDEEKHEFVNAKLAMITLQQKRHDLTRKYGPLDEVLSIFYPYTDSYDDLPDNQKRSLQRYRKAQSANISEYLAYQYMQDRQSAFYDEVDCLVQEMTQYQGVSYEELMDIEYNDIYIVERPFVRYDLQYYPGIEYPPSSALKSIDNCEQILFAE